MSRVPIPPGPYDLNARLSAPRRGQPAVVPAECYEWERNRAIEARARIAALEAELARANSRTNYFLHLLDNIVRMANGKDPLPAGTRIVEIQTDGTNRGVL